jgi:3-hydroxyisobutyrate dehydrogenase
VKRLAFIGIGNMGWPMAANLVSKGFDVTVCDTDAARVARFVAEIGGHAAAGAAEAVAGAEAVITILPTSKQVAQVAALVVTPDQHSGGAYEGLPAAALGIGVRT